METDKKTIHMSCTKGKEEIMITVDDDYILSENKPDIKGKIKECGDIHIEKVRGMEGRISVAGYLHYQLLYSTQNGCDCMEGKIPFEEIIAMENVTPQDILKCLPFLEDISIHIIHARKISVKALIRLNVTAKALCSRDAVNELHMENLQCRKKKLDVMNLMSSQKDIYRIRESISLPSTGDSAGKILWYELQPESMELRLRDGELAIKGDLSVFCIYSSMQEENGINYHSEKIPFSGKIVMNNSEQESYPDIDVSISEKSLTLRPDSNGEMKLLDIEMILDVDIKAYGEECHEILEDAYSPTCGLKLQKESVACEAIIMKNNMQCRVEQQFRTRDDDIMQVLNSAGTVYIEDVINNKDQITVEGSITVDVLYQKADGDNPIGHARYRLPFGQKIEGVEPGEYLYNCKAEGLKVNVEVVGEEMDIKCVLGIDMMITKPITENIINDVLEGEPDYDRIKNLPGITGYITKSDDTLWDIAKRYGTTVNKIMETNNLASEDIKTGMKLLVVKSC